MVVVSAEHLDDLAIQARYARERYQLYKARALSSRPTSPQRLSELHRAYEQAEARLRFAQAEQQRSRGERRPEQGGHRTPADQNPRD